MLDMNLRGGDCCKEESGSEMWSRALPFVVLCI